jgi:DNA helicase II / ATP-dependent DNA helicase PcrA
MTMAESTDGNVSERGAKSAMDTIVAEEERVLTRVQKHVASREGRTQSDGLDYDAELLSLRNQIQEARLEDIPPLIEEMERLTEVAARRAKVTEGSIDAASPYFGRLVLEENDKKREVLIGKSTYLDPRTGIRIVDWRDAPVSRIYYRYEEGDSYDENFGGRDVQGEVLTRRSIAIASGLLRRIGAPQGTFARSIDGTWRQLGASASKLAGGQGAAMRPDDHHSPAERGKLGMGVDGREDRFLPEITALIDPRQFELITKSDAGLVVIQGGAGSGKTTIGLHRLAYLAFQDPARFHPEKMLVIVYNDALVRYISRVIPSLLGAQGREGTVPVTTFQRWAEKQRIAHVHRLPREYSDEIPTSAVRLKKSAALLRMIDDVVRRGGETTRAWLDEALEGQEGKSEVLRYFDASENAPLGVRLLRLSRWVSAERDEDGGRDLAPEAARAVSSWTSCRCGPSF